MFWGLWWRGWAGSWRINVIDYGRDRALILAPCICALLSYLQIFLILSILSAFMVPNKKKIGSNLLYNSIICCVRVGHLLVKYPNIPEAI